MTPIRRIVLLLALASPAVAPAQSRTALAISGGPSFPLGRFKNTHASGTEYGIGIIRGSDDVPVGLRLDFGVDRLKGKTISGVTTPDARTVSGTLNVVFSLSGYSVKPYFLAGGGGFKMTTQPATPNAKTRFGFDFGLGFTVPVGTKALFVESRLNSITQPSAKPIRYLPIVFGILF